jgi:transposase
VRFELNENERKVLREIQRQNHKRDYVKATVLLMLDLDETPQKIALFLGIDDGTVYRHLENYQKNGLDKFLGNNYFGYVGKLDAAQIISLKKAFIRDLSRDLRPCRKAIFNQIYRRRNVRFATSNRVCV